MKSSEFNENYSIDRTAKGIKAVEKTTGLKRRKPEIFLTKNGQAYNPEREYFFYDKQFKDVKSSKGFKQEDEFLATFGLKVAAISDLFKNKDGALVFAQESIKKEINGLYTLIAKFESQKKQKAKVNNEN